MSNETNIVKYENHNLLPLSNKVKKLSDKALSVLEDALASEDEKIRMDAAKTLLKMDVDISKVINEDAMSRLLLELKHNGNPAPKETLPMVDFSNIQEV